MFILEFGLKKKWAEMNNKGNSGAMESQDFTKVDRSEEIILAENKDIEKYLSVIELKANGLLSDQELRIYQKIREEMWDGLPEKVRGEFVYVALIERVARTAVFLERIERLLLKMDVPATSLLKGTAKMDYMKIQEEHRKCVELYANLRWAEDRKGKVRTLEEIRRSVIESG